CPVHRQRNKISRSVDLRTPATNRISEHYRAQSVRTGRPQKVGDESTRTGIFTDRSIGTPKSGWSSAATVRSPPLRSTCGPEYRFSKTPPRLPCWIRNLFQFRLSRCLTTRESYASASAFAWKAVDPPKLICERHSLNDCRGRGASPIPAK